jgi:hypothetical protein
LVSLGLDRSSIVSRQVVEGVVAESIKISFSLLGHVDDPEREPFPPCLGLNLAI